MPSPPPERKGQALRVNGQLVSFSIWATRKGNRGYVLQPEVLSNSPWDVISYAVKNKFAARSANRKACLSFLEQAKAFYFASKTNDEAARPLLLYYSFLNLAKSFIIFSGVESNLDGALHGIKERRGSRAFVGSTVEVFRANASRKNIYDLLGQALGMSPLSTNRNYKVIKHLIPQIVIGHRLWSSASGKAQKFVRCERIEFQHDEEKMEIWLRLAVRRDDINGCHISHSQFLNSTRLSSDFRIVTPEDKKLRKTCVVFEQMTAVKYTRRPSDELHSVVGTMLKNQLAPILRLVPPYRRYYLSLMSPNNRRLPALLAAYGLIYYLGSVTRYRPYEYESIRDSNYGMFIAEFVQTHGQQFWYQLASEFLKQDVSLPAVLH